MRRLGHRQRPPAAASRSSPQPSTLAASMYSFGIVSRNCRSRKIENASPNAIGMISGHSVPDRWSCLRPEQVHRDDRRPAAAASSSRSPASATGCGRGSGTWPARRPPGCDDTHGQHGAEHRVDQRVAPPGRGSRGCPRPSRSCDHSQVCGHRSRVSACSSLISDGQERRRRTAARRRAPRRRRGSARRSSPAAACGGPRAAAAGEPAARRRAAGVSRVAWVMRSVLRRQEAAAAPHQERGERPSTARTAPARRRTRSRSRSAGSRGCRRAGAGSGSTCPGSRARTAGPSRR